ncbi:hypothetical protein BVAVS116_H0120 (plasmid) [Borreliella valaisiana VS116]|uniref:Uncharacterized protein n=1 Tax=Borreliella valaisiana VS116 TaxID=445987 RepID=C0R935_BORVA|nr:hypothetical protein BVAVS116_H0120 [Borreliella valaisiana VS116]
MSLIPSKNYKLMYPSSFEASFKQLQKTQFYYCPKSIFDTSKLTLGF